MSDYGDAPEPYPTTSAESGAAHTATGPMLGASRDAEPDGTHSPMADADGADEDGVTFGTMAVGALDASLTVNVQGGSALLDAWFDFNGDGSWGGPGEQVFDTVAVGPVNPLAFDVPSWAEPGTTFARFRLSTQGGLGVGGSATDGEVEDYQVTILPPAEASEAFEAHTITTEINDPQSVYAADIDGDGDMDVLSASLFGDNIVWHENDPILGFTTHTISTDADWARSIFAADVDGDGDMDVLSASMADDKIAWYENDPNLGFTTHIISTDADGAWSVFAADVDGDGDMDVLSASRYDDKIAWYENDGSQAFTPHTISTAADRAASVFAADVDGDGDMDVLSASRLYDSLAWYENDGSQNFTQRTVANTAFSAESVFAADIDGDGDTDVVGASAVYDVAWYENDGSEAFTQHTITSNATGAQDAFAADVDGDGDMDILGAFANGEEIVWYENDGSGAFTQHTITNNARGAESVFAADIDGDGDMDVLSASSAHSTQSKIVWYENLDTGYDFTAETFSADEGDSTNTTMVVMVERSGRIDIATSVDVIPTDGTATAGQDYSPAPVTIVFEPGETTQPAPLVLLGETEPEYDETVLLSLANFSDGSGPGTVQPTAVLTIVNDDPIVEGDYGDAPLPYPTTFLEEGALHDVVGPTLGASRDAEPDGTHSPMADADGADEDGVTFGTMTVGALDASVTVNVQGGSALLDAWIDFNGDGAWGGPGEQILDSVAVNPDDNPLLFDIPSWAEPGTTFARFRLSTAGNLGVGGFAADGEVEDYQVTILPPAESAASFQPRTIATAAEADGARSVFAADVDGDGDMDVLSASSSDDKIAWYENDGSGAFTQHTISTDASGAPSVFAADVDGDGDIDVLSASTGAGITWYENDGSQVFTPHTISAVGALSIFAADVDSDGDIDVLSPSGGEGITWYENDGSQTFTPRAISSSQYARVYAADIDGDGDMDVLAASYDDFHIHWFENDGSQGFTKQYVTEGYYGGRAVLAADIDGDGDMDVASTSYDGGVMDWYENQGPLFDVRYVSNDSVGIQSVFAADVDGDGDMDLLSAGHYFYENRILWYENNGSGEFTTHTISTDAHDAFSVFAADIDGDGDLDVLSASSDFYDNDQIVWYENTVVQLLGDMDLDGDVDLDDVDDFVQGLVEPEEYEATYGVSPTVNGDTDQDGDLDLDDVDDFVAILTGGRGGGGGHGSSEQPPDADRSANPPGDLSAGWFRFTSSRQSTPRLPSIHDPLLATPDDLLADADALQLPTADDTTSTERAVPRWRPVRESIRPSAHHTPDAPAHDAALAAHVDWLAKYRV